MNQTSTAPSQIRYTAIAIVFNRKLSKNSYSSNTFSRRQRKMLKCYYFNNRLLLVFIAVMASNFKLLSLFFLGFVINGRRHESVFRSSSTRRSTFAHIVVEEKNTYCIQPVAKFVRIAVTTEVLLLWFMNELVREDAFFL